MAKRKIRWSLRAQQDRLHILEYWINRNKSSSYSKKLYELINSAVELLSEYPEIGKLTVKPEITAKVVKDYLTVHARVVMAHGLLSVDFRTFSDFFRVNLLVNFVVWSNKDNLSFLNITLRTFMNP